MAVLTAKSISALAVELLARLLVLPNTVARVPGMEFSGDVGDTVTIRVRQPRTAKVQSVPGAPITFDPLDEVPVDVTVDQLYDAVRVTDHDLTLNIADFGRQVLEPMMRGVAIGAEDQVATVMNTVPADVATVTAATVEADILAARTTLGRDEVPLGNRFLACSPEFAEIMLALDNLSDVAAGGSASALRDAAIGRYRGFTVVETAGLTAGTALAYHESAFVWGNRAPVAPAGAASAEATVAQGIALLTVRDYDISILSDAVAISTFAGASTVDAGRVVKLALAP